MLIQQQLNGVTGKLRKFAKIHILFLHFFKDNS